MRNHLLRSLLPVFLASALTAQDSVAVYDVELEATWSAATHGISYPFGARFASDAPSAFFPSGILVPNVGLALPGTPGELLLGGNLVESLSGASWTGTTVVFQVPIPNLAGLVDARFHLQGILAAPTPRFGLTEARALHRPLTPRGSGTSAAGERLPAPAARHERVPA